jgi:small subunit ribosomal protein S3
MARSETQKMGSIPLHTLDADVDYATATARTTYGAIGIKVWVYRGKFGEVLEPTERHQHRRPPRRMGPSSGGSEPMAGPRGASGTPDSGRGGPGTGGPESSPPTQGQA